MKRVIPVCLASLLYLAPAATAAEPAPQPTEIRKVRSRAPIVPPLVQAIAKRLGTILSNIDGPLPPRP